MLKQKNDNQPPALLEENIYGHLKRLNWIESKLTRDDKILEVGCGTGYMICLPLRLRGLMAEGIDIDSESINYGRKLCADIGLDQVIKCIDLSETTGNYDVIIVSEVLEHLKDDELETFLPLIYKKLKPGGRLLVTVPNGNGWFELESFLWNRCRLGWLIEKINLDRVIRCLKRIFLNVYINESYPSTLSSSPHVQKFTWRSIRQLLNSHGFTEYEEVGSVMFAGPLSNLLFSGIKSVMRLNSKLGTIFPGLASGFYIACERRDYE